MLNSAAGGLEWEVGTGWSGANRGADAFFWYKDGASRFEVDSNGDIHVTGNVRIGTDNTYDIGSGTNAFKDIHLDGKILFDYSKRIAMPDANIFMGEESGIYNTGQHNSFYGYFSGRNHTTGNANSFFGSNTGIYNTTGEHNAFFGYAAGGNNTTGVENTLLGSFAGYTNTTGLANTFVGTNSGFLNTSGNNNTSLGYNTGPVSSNLSNSMALGSGTVTTASYQVRIGNSTITSIGGQVSWSTLSDGRFKNDVQENVAGLDFINQLRPVSYTVNKEAYNTFLGVKPEEHGQQSEARKLPTRQTGFVAQEVEAIIKKSGYVFHGVEAPQNDKDPYTLRYGEFVVPLVKAVQELNAKVEEQQKTIDRLLNQKNNIATNEIEQSAFSGIRLFQNNPNPFSLDTKIKMSLPEKVNQALLIIYNLEGKQLKDIPVRERGNIEVTISGYELSAGMYIYALIADNNVVDTKRMILTK